MKFSYLSNYFKIKIETLFKTYPRENTNTACILLIGIVNDKTRNFFIKQVIIPINLSIT